MDSVEKEKKPKFLKNFFMFFEMIESWLKNDWKLIEFLCLFPLFFVFFDPKKDSIDPPKSLKLSFILPQPQFLLKIFWLNLF